LLLDFCFDMKADQACLQDAHLPKNDAGLLHVPLMLLLCVTCQARLPPWKWDSAAADIIVSEAGGVVVQAGKVTGKEARLLEDWKVKLVPVCGGSWCRQNRPLVLQKCCRPASLVLCLC